MIFGYLTPTERASLRLMSSTIAAIGLKYIAISTTLTLQEDSFDRLLDIARHPVVSKFVRSLYYEHGSLSRFSRAEWEENIRTPKLTAAQNGIYWSEFPGNNGSERGLRAFHRERNAIKAYNTYGKKRLDQAFSTYQKHCAEEDRARRSGFFLDKLISALQHFPNLETIYMLTGSFSRYNAELVKILKGASYYHQIIHVHNLAVTRSVLAAVDRVIRDNETLNDGATNVDNGPALIARSQDPGTANDNDLVRNDQVKFGPGDGTSNPYCPEITIPGRSQSILRIKKFVSEYFDPSLLLEGVHVFSTMNRSLSHLTKLDFHLIDGYDVKLSKVNVLHQFVKLASGLKELSVSLNGDTFLSAVGLPDVVGSFHWTSLKLVHFSMITIDAGNLQEFCSRHSSTLSNFSLGCVLMGGHANTSVAGRTAWDSMFTKIRETTKLEKACIYGFLQIHCYPYDMHDRADVRLACGTLIARYLTGEGGKCSLEYFVRDERRRISAQNRSSLFNEKETGLRESSMSDRDNSSSDDDA